MELSCRSCRHFRKVGAMAGRSSCSKGLQLKTDMTTENVIEASGFCEELELEPKGADPERPP